MTVVLGPLPCRGCGSLVEWDRVGQSWRLVERAKGRIVEHRCGRHGRAGATARQEAHP